MEEEPTEIPDAPDIEMPSIGEINAIYMAEGCDQARTIAVLRGMGM